MLSDSNIHAPPTTGAQNYSTMAMIAVGATYVDGVFNETVMRMTNQDGLTTGQNTYAFHNINADGTGAFSWVLAGDLSIISTSSGSVLYDSQPTGVGVAEVRWHPTDPDKYFYFTGNNLTRRNLAAQTNTTIKNFGAALQNMGGTGNYCDRTARYFIVQYGGTVKLWDSQPTDTIYSNPVTPFGGGGWTGLTPSGNNIYTAAGGTAMPNQEHHAYAINHGTQTVAASPIQVWGMGGDHGALVSPTDGKDYVVVSDNNTSSGIFRVDLATSAAGKTEAQQVDASFSKLLFNDQFRGFHASGGSTGNGQDWVFVSHEDGADNFNDAPSPWIAFEQEIIAINVLTGALRRLCHHRSRAATGGFGNNYQGQPRVSCAVDGSAVMYASNFNDSTPVEYCDLYVIMNPLGAAAEAAANEVLMAQACL